MDLFRGKAICYQLFSQIPGRRHESIDVVINLHPALNLHGQDTNTGGKEGSLHAFFANAGAIALRQALLAYLPLAEEIEAGAQQKVVRQTRNHRNVHFLGAADYTGGKLVYKVENIDQIRFCLSNLLLDCLFDLRRINTALQELLNDSGRLFILFVVKSIPATDGIYKVFFIGSCHIHAGMR